MELLLRYLVLTLILEGVATDRGSLGWSCYDAFFCNFSFRDQFSDVIVALERQPFNQITSN